MTDLLRFSMAQWRLEPETGMQDAYKWLFHATQGGEHAIYQPEGPRRQLDREWKTLAAPRPGEKLIQPLRPDGKIVRLNLRPYRARGGAPEPLFNAFLASAKGYKPDKTGFHDVWQELGTALKSKNLNSLLSRANWESLEGANAAHVYPPVDHSEAYVRKIKPAYRVLTGDEAKRLTATLRPG